MTATGTLPRAQRARAGLDAEQLEDLGETGRRASRRQAPAPRRRVARRGTEGIPSMEAQSRGEGSERPARPQRRPHRRASAPVAGSATAGARRVRRRRRPLRTEPGSRSAADRRHRRRWRPKRRRRRGGRGAVGAGAGQQVPAMRAGRRQLTQRRLAERPSRSSSRVSARRCRASGAAQACWTDTTATRELDRRRVRATCCTWLSDCAPAARRSPSRCAALRAAQGRAASSAATSRPTPASGVARRRCVACATATDLARQRRALDLPGHLRVPGLPANHWSSSPSA